MGARTQNKYAFQLRSVYLVDRRSPWKSSKSLTKETKTQRLENTVNMRSGKMSSRALILIGSEKVGFLEPLCWNRGKWFPSPAFSYPLLSVSTTCHWRQALSQMRRTILFIFKNTKEDRNFILLYTEHFTCVPISKPLCKVYQLWLYYKIKHGLFFIVRFIFPMHIPSFIIKDNQELSIYGNRIRLSGKELTIL